MAPSTEMDSSDQYKGASKSWLLSIPDGLFRFALCLHFLERDEWLFAEQG